MVEMKSPNASCEQLVSRWYSGGLEEVQWIGEECALALAAEVKSVSTGRPLTSLQPTHYCTYNSTVVFCVRCSPTTQLTVSGVGV